VSDDQAHPGRLGRRWRARRDQLRSDVDLGSSNARIRDNPYLLLLKYGCIGTGILGLLMQPFGADAAPLSYWLLSWAGLSLVAYIVTCALLWRPPPGDPPAGQHTTDDTSTPPATQP
jgi:hypothetical protein